ncbi:type II toxin-antitoxin system HicB family antitoxin [Candidatus Obscuribacterales bacterium]|nr:type II toxin-antitoxin system HicB family antitoxin [Candidatus Obscuribacterales bacterium]MBX3152981.1 type II toxin-antitoxin system HicB family antitoxin [Candidatus Obscuribacterales bacterium]
MNVFNVRYKRDSSGWWVATIVEVAGCHTQGKSIAQTRNRLREALSLYVDDVVDAEFIEHICLPRKANELVRKVVSARRKVAEDEAALQSSTMEAACHLTEDLGVSLRDAGEVLALSFQRVQQLTASKSKR